MRAAHHVPTEDFSVQGLKVSYPAKYRGQILQLTGIVIFKIYDRNYAQDFYRIQPDVVEEYRNLTTYALSVCQSDVTILEVQNAIV